MEIRLSDHFTYKKLLKFTLPAIIMMVFTSLYGVVDGLFVTNFAGKTSLAAINFVYPVINILGTFGYMFGTGGSALVTKTMGEGDTDKANKLFSLFVYITTLLGVVFAVIGFSCLKPLLHALGAEGEMLSDAVLYGYILLAALPFWSLQFLFQIFFVSAEKPKLGLYVTLAAGFTNIIFDALLVGVFKYGIVGAAIATALSQLVGGAIPLIYFKLPNSSALKLTKTNIDYRAIGKASSNGLSEFVSGVANSLVGILFNTQLMKYAGENGVAAYGIMMYVSFIFIGIFFGYVNGSASLVGFNYGAKNYDELKNLRKKSINLMIISSIAMLVLSLSLSVPLSKIFAGYDKELYDLTLYGFKIFSISFVFSGIAIFGSSFFTALNNGVVSALLSFLRTVVYQVSCVLVFPLFFGIDGIWYSIVVAEALAFISTVICLLIFQKKYRY